MAMMNEWCVFLVSTSTCNLKNRGGGSGLDYVILLSQGGGGGLGLDYG